MRITNEEIDAMPTASFDKRIVVVDTAEGAALAAEEMKGAATLGFDTETRPSFQRGVSYKTALLQLSDGETAWLVRMNKIGLPQPIIDVLADPKILKIGLAIRDDIRGLQRRHKFDAANFQDLQTIAKERGFEDFSLKKIAAIVLRVKISKRQRLTNWEAESLTLAQQVYAATDAWISREIYLKMVE